MSKDITQAVREICLGLPQAEEFISHGAPNFRVRAGKIFATYAVNVHGDGRIALWLPAPAGALERWTETAPEHFFKPPYVGVRGWLGVQLDRGLDWVQIAERIHEAYRQIAPARLQSEMGDPPLIAPPTLSLPPEQFDPLSTPAAQVLLQRVRAECLKLPECTESLQYGDPIWRAGKRGFALVHHDREHLRLQARVGLDAQGLYAGDPRYRIPPFTGAQGWISLQLDEDSDWAEVRGLLHQSYRHFALRRMLKGLSE